ncbi:uncharacterized protein B0H18DRAFT_1015624 [Fomitopsis serialis]|uniref:uncharacterized protein n=1 Tax=Fomitopsis serialis TaxID=139415 RepID=UPI002007A3CE|nr:uncharacterized protein B0H18DRAFT_1015624 [Neoantrodia serialis]KAH9923288.1 hypothetical protein B0H18DRAFT_1015624 [Neoantrodia serialis]
MDFELHFTSLPDDIILEVASKIVHLRQRSRRREVFGRQRHPTSDVHLIVRWSIGDELLRVLIFSAMELCQLQSLSLPDDASTSQAPQSRPSSLVSYPSRDFLDLLMKHIDDLSHVVDKLSQGDGTLPKLARVRIELVIAQCVATVSGRLRLPQSITAASAGQELEDTIKLADYLTAANVDLVSEVRSFDRDTNASPLTDEGAKARKRLEERVTEHARLVNTLHARAFTSPGYACAWASWMDLGVVAYDLYDLPGQTLEISRATELLQSIVEERNVLLKRVKVLDSKDFNMKSPEWIEVKRALLGMNLLFSVHVGDIQGLV